MTTATSMGLVQVQGEIEIRQGEQQQQRRERKKWENCSCEGNWTI